MKVKVCGMRVKENISQVLKLEPDYMGFIFYERSKRYVNDLKINDLNFGQTKRVGVFVNPDSAAVVNKKEEYNLDLIQLHGDEDANFCKDLNDNGHDVMKVFHVDTDFDMNSINNYKPFCKYFLFDTASENYGGTGKAFNWDILKEYDNEIPLFLSGGIGLDNIEEINQLDYLNIQAIDINSKVEIEPGLKDVKKIKELISAV
ncbi:MAG: N-(5'-phosphoribosyl)anthranilate isomerase [Bacteroidetes bacterium]|nr:MAG: N-(5'-phosphoribosyl)anthranilate isomerase [Bacteroidota bacterium]